MYHIMCDIHLFMAQMLDRRGANEYKEEKPLYEVQNASFNTL